MSPHRICSRESNFTEKIQEIAVNADRPCRSGLILDHTQLFTVRLASQPYFRDIVGLWQLRNERTREICMHDRYTLNNQFFQ